VWTAPDTFRVAETPEQVTEKAAQEFARLARLLRQKGEDPDWAGSQGGTVRRSMEEVFVASSP
jgi:hypothetical protein